MEVRVIYSLQLKNSQHTSIKRHLPLSMKNLTVFYVRWRWYAFKKLPKRWSYSSSSRLASISNEDRKMERTPSARRCYSMWLMSGPPSLAFPRRRVKPDKRYWGICLYFYRTIASNWHSDADVRVGRYFFYAHKRRSNSSARAF